MKKLLLTRVGFQLMMGDTQLKVKLLFLSRYGTVAYHSTIKIHTQKARKVPCAASALSPFSPTLPFCELPSPSEPETRSCAPPGLPRSSPVPAALPRAHALLDGRAGRARAERAAARGAVRIYQRDSSRWGTAGSGFASPHLYSSHCSLPLRVMSKLCIVRTYLLIQRGRTRPFNS